MNLLVYVISSPICFVRKILQKILSKKNQKKKIPKKKKVLRFSQYFYIILCTTGYVENQSVKNYTQKGF